MMGEQMKHLERNLVDKASGSDEVSLGFDWQACADAIVKRSREFQELCRDALQSAPVSVSLAS